MNNTPLRTAMIIIVILLVFANLFVYMNNNALTSEGGSSYQNSSSNNEQTDEAETTSETNEIATSDKAKAIIASFQAADLVNLSDLDPSIQIDLRYGTANNFLEKDLYGGLNECYLQEEVAKMLSKAQEFLKEKHPRLSLLVLDCARPWSIQKEMWEHVKGTDKEQYVASPYGGSSVHGYGSAVDVTIVDGDGKEVDMGTPFDFFGDMSQPRYEKRFSETGELTQQQIFNRNRLLTVMKKAGFVRIQTEWWHFNAFPKELVKKKYKMVE